MSVSRTTLSYALAYLTLALCFLANPIAAVAQERTRPITASDLATLVDLDALSVSPDGRRAAFQTRRADQRTNAYVQEWNIVSTTGGAPRRLADAGAPILQGTSTVVNGFIQAPPPVWSPDSQWIAYLRKEDGRTQIWRARIDGRRSEQITHGESDARAPVFSSDGRRLLFETEASQVQIAAQLAQEGLAGFLYDSRFAPSYSRMPVLPSDIRTDAQARVSGESSELIRAQRRIRVVDLASHAERPATDIEMVEFTALTAPPRANLRFGANAAVSPSGALVWTDARDPAQQGGRPPLTIVVQSAEEREPVVCAAVECTGQSIKGLWWRNDDEVLFVRGEGVLFQDSALYTWRRGAATPRLVLRTPNLFASSSDWKCAIAQDRLVCFYEEPARPRRLVAINLETGVVETLYDPNPNFARFNLGPPPIRVEFHSPLAGENYGYLVLPPGRRDGERLSLVIVTYRCKGFLRGGIGDEYPIFPFAAQGHAVLCFNVPDLDFARAATMAPDAYTSWARGEGDPEINRVQEGLDAALAQLDRLGVIDPERVGLTGLSYGAETVMYAMFHMPQLAAAIASGTEIGPASSFLYGPAQLGLQRQWGLGWWDSPRWDSLSITRNAERIRAPLLLNVPDHEMFSALHPYAALKDAGRAVEMYVFPDEYHIKWQPAHRLAIYNRNIDWMNFWLRSVEDPDPVKATQYERWRGMRAAQSPEPQ